MWYYPVGPETPARRHLAVVRHGGIVSDPSHAPSPGPPRRTHRKLQKKAVLADVSLPGQRSQRIEPLRSPANSANFSSLLSATTEKGGAGGRLAPARLQDSLGKMPPERPLLPGTATLRRHRPFAAPREVNPV